MQTLWAPPASPSPTSRPQGLPIALRTEDESKRPCTSHPAHSERGHSASVLLPSHSLRQADSSAFRPSFLPDSLLPQGPCMCCFLNLEHSFSNYVLLQILAQGLSPREAFLELWHLNSLVTGITAQALSCT